MANSVNLDKHGPDWPLGFIGVVTPGTPVNIMSVVDPGLVNDPSKPVPGTTGANEYSNRAQQIMFQGVKPGASHGLQNNTGNVYIMRKGVPPGTGNRDDTGSIVFMLAPGQTIFLASAALVRNVYSPYRYSIDGDNVGDGALVTLIMQ